MIITGKMKKFEIKITGSGTPLEIIDALAGVQRSILATMPELDDVEWEDPILMTEISALTSEDMPGSQYPPYPKITREDIKQVAKELNQTLTDVEIEWVKLCYEDAQRQDPSATWNLVVDDLINQIPRIRDNN
jgi:hypothetical protein